MARNGEAARIQPTFASPTRGSRQRSDRKGRRICRKTVASGNDRGGSCSIFSTDADLFLRGRFLAPCTNSRPGLHRLRSAPFFRSPLSGAEYLFLCAYGSLPLDSRLSSAVAQPSDADSRHGWATRSSRHHWRALELCIHTRSRCKPAGWGTIGSYVLLLCAGFALGDNMVRRLMIALTCWPARFTGNCHRPSECPRRPRCAFAIRGGGGIALSLCRNDTDHHAARCCGERAGACGAATSLRAGCRTRCMAGANCWYFWATHFRLEDAP